MASRTNVLGSTSHYAIPHFTSSLTSQQAINIMSTGGSTPDLYVTQNLLDFAGTKRKHLRYSLVIRNLSTGVDTLITKPPDYPKITDDFSQTWLTQHIEDPVFHNIDLDNLTIPFLESPLHYLDTQTNLVLPQSEICTSCIFAAGPNEMLQAF